MSELVLSQLQSLGQSYPIRDNLAAVPDFCGIQSGKEFDKAIADHERTNPRTVVIIFGEPVTAKTTLIGELAKRRDTLLSRRRRIYMPWGGEMLVSTGGDPKKFGTLTKEGFLETSKSYEARVRRILEDPNIENITVFCKVPAVTAHAGYHRATRVLTHVAHDHDAFVASIIVPEADRRGYIQLLRSIHELKSPLDTAGKKQLKDILKEFGMTVPGGLNHDEILHGLQMDGATEHAVGVIKQQVNQAIINLKQRGTLPGQIPTMEELNTDDDLRTTEVTEYLKWLLNAAYNIKPERRFLPINYTIYGKIKLYQKELDKINHYKHLPN